MIEAVDIAHIQDELKRIQNEMVMRKEIESLFATIEVLGNSETMKQIAESLNQGKARKVLSVRDILRDEKHA